MNSFSSPVFLQSHIKCIRTYIYVSTRHHQMYFISTIPPKYTCKAHRNQSFGLQLQSTDTRIRVQHIFIERKSLTLKAVPIMNEKYLV